MNQAHEVVEDYLNQSSNTDLEATEIMEFEYNFSVIFTEKSTVHMPLKRLYILVPATFTVSRART